jgi:hypothetical protein
MIRIDLRSARGEVLDSLRADPVFDPVLAGIDRMAYPILGHIDPYGDTVLNSMQVETLLTEITRLLPESSVIPDRFANALIQICRKCLSRPHQFIWFVGE